MITRSILFILLTSLSCFGSLQEEASDYAKKLFSKHKDLQTKNTRSKSVKAFVEELKGVRGMFHLDPSINEKLKKRKNIITDAAFKAGVSKLTKYKTQNEAAFLIAYVEKHKTRREKQLFLHRYIEHKIKAFEEQIKLANLQQLKDFLKIYVEKKESLGKKPKITELELPEKLAKYKNPANHKLSDWLYLGDKAISSIGANKTQLVVALPFPTPTKKVLLIKEDGSTSSQFNYERIKKTALETPAKPTPPKPDNKTPGPQLAKPKITPEHLQILVTAANKVIAQHKLYKNSKIFPKAKSNAISQLEFKGGPEEKYKSEDGSSPHPWIYTGATHKVTHGGKRIICITSTPVYGDNHLGFFIDGTHIEISPEQFTQIKEHGIAPHK